MLGACGDGSSTESALDRYLCESSDLPGDFFEQTRGDFSPENLADLSSDADARKTELAKAGLVAGRFSYWKEAVGKPPFDPPTQVVCQALQFRDAVSAEAFVASVKATPEDLVTTGMVWLPEASRQAREVQAPGKEPGVRAFEMSAGEGSEAVRVYVFFDASDGMAQSLYIGGAGEVPSLEEAAATFARVREQNGK